MIARFITNVQNEQATEEKLGPIILKIVDGNCGKVGEKFLKGILLSFQEVFRHA